MILKICRQDRNKSLYKCDRCNAKCKLNECKGIFVTNDLGRAVKEWDLCLKCYEALKRGIQRRKEGIKNGKEKNKNSM